MKNIKAFFSVIYKNKQAFIGLMILIIFITMAIAGNFITVDMTIDYQNRYQGPSLKHILGTDHGGRDTFLQLVRGSTDVLAIGLFSAIFTLILGFTLGGLAGFLGGWVDTSIMFVANVFSTLPYVPMVLLLSTMVKLTNNIAFAGVMAIFSWAGLTRNIRAQILSLKHREFIRACKVMGLKTSYILFQEIMPNIISYITMNFISNIQNSINLSMGLMMLGIAPYSPTNWGTMVHIALKTGGGIFNTKGYLYLFLTIGTLCLFQLGNIFFSSGIDEAMNPRLRGN